MDAPLCRTCKTRHSMKEPCVFPVSVLCPDDFDPMIRRREAIRTPKKIEGEIRAAMDGALRASTKTVGVVVPVDEKGEPVCLVCAARRAKRAAAQKRWREKRK